MCLVCTLNPIERRDFDGFCISCRAAVADGLYRIERVYSEQTRSYYRVVQFATIGEHILGTEYPNHVDPIPYNPELLPALWRELDKLAADEARAETVLGQLTRLGA